MKAGKSSSIGAMPAMPSSMGASDGDGDEYQARDDMRTLIAAHHITSDKKRHGAAKAMVKKHLTAMKAIAGAPTNAQGGQNGEGQPVNKAPGKGSGPNFTD